MPTVKPDPEIFDQIEEVQEEKVKDRPWTFTTGSKSGSFLLRDPPSLPSRCCTLLGPGNLPGHVVSMSEVVERNLTLYSLFTETRDSGT